MTCWHVSLCYAAAAVCLLVCLHWMHVGIGGVSRLAPATAQLHGAQGVASGCGPAAEPECCALLTEWLEAGLTEWLEVRMCSDLITLCCDVHPCRCSGPCGIIAADQSGHMLAAGGRVGPCMVLLSNVCTARAHEEGTSGAADSRTCVITVLCGKVPRCA